MKTFREGDWLATTPIFVGTAPLRICPAGHDWAIFHEEDRPLDTQSGEMVPSHVIVERCANCDGARSRFKPDKAEDMEKFRL